MNAVCLLALSTLFGPFFKKIKFENIYSTGLFMTINMLENQFL